MSSIDIVNSSRVQLQVVHKAPTVIIDKTDGCQLFLSRENADIEILSAKSSELNVVLPQEDSALDPKEFAVAEQLRTVIDLASNKLITTAVEHKG